MNPKKKLSIVEISPTRAPAPKRERPTSILEPGFRYTPSSATDLRAKFKSLGFKTPKPRRPKFGK